jgi:tripartite-type tricarboxylate transporter receptor subunit TctC
MQPCRRRFLRLAGAAAGLPLVARMSAAQAYPTRPVRIIVPFTAGGPATVMAHVIAQPLSESLGQSFYVENLPAGASNVGTATAAKSPPDGYTLLIVTPSFVINPSMYAKLAYDPIKDFTPVMLAVTSPHVLIVHPSFPAKNVKELIALAKANPGKYSYASAGTGQSAQLAAELFKLAFGLDIVHVPFNGGAPAMNSTIGGHTPIAFNALPSAASLIKEGKLRALAVTSPQRSPEFPDVPTLAERARRAKSRYSSRASSLRPERRRRLSTSFIARSIKFSRDRRSRNAWPQSVSPSPSAPPRSSRPRSNPKRRDGRKSSATPTSRQSSDREPSGWRE